MNSAAIKSKIEQLEKSVPVKDLNFSFVEYIHEISNRIISQVSPKFYYPRETVQHNLESVVFNVTEYLADAHALEYLNPHFHSVADASNEQFFSSIGTLLDVVKSRYFFLSPSGGYSTPTDEAVLDAVGDAMMPVGLPKTTVQDQLDQFLSVILDHKVIPVEYRKFCLAHNFKEGSGYPRSFISYLFKTVSSIREKYDLGIGLAQGGLYAAFFFELAGLPIMTVEMKRKGTGATWQPQPDFDGQKIKGKRVLVLENDIDTGRTLRRACREINCYHSESISVCFMEGNELCRIENLPPSITEHYHLTKPWKEDTIKIYRHVTRQLAERFNDEYQIFSQRTDLP